MMNNKLQEILMHKQQEVALLKQHIAENPEHPVAKIAHGERLRRVKKSFKQTLTRAEIIHVIAEIKRRSPSKGTLADIADPLQLVEKYVSGGAAAISVLTDSYGFGGSLQDLQQVSHALAETDVPILRKDFLIDPLQIAEAIAYGADAVLLIVSVLKEKLPTMLQVARQLHIDALVEVHTQEEITQAMAAGAEIIGVNNRNLQTLQMDMQCAFNLMQYLPKNVIKIAESGIATPELAKQYYAHGYDAVLVGETLVKSTTPAEWIAQCG